MAKASLRQYHLLRIHDPVIGNKGVHVHARLQGTALDGDVPFSVGAYLNIAYLSSLHIVNVKPGFTGY